MTTGTVCSALEFAAIARALGAESHRLGLVVPAFRSHPREGTRAIRRLREGAVVLIDLHRPVSEVARDMVDGVLAANRVTDAQVREVLCEAAGGGTG